MTNDERLAEIERRLTEIETRVDVMIEKTGEGFAEHERAIAASGFRDVRELTETIRNVSIVVLGDDELGIEPLRPMVVRLQTAYDRAKWIAGSLATTNVGSILAWVSTLLK